MKTLRKSDILQGFVPHWRAQYLLPLSKLVSECLFTGSLAPPTPPSQCGSYRVSSSSTLLKGSKGGLGLPLKNTCVAERLLQESNNRGSPLLIAKNHLMWSPPTRMISLANILPWWALIAILLIASLRVSLPFSKLHTFPRNWDDCWDYIGLRAEEEDETCRLSLVGICMDTYQGSDQFVANYVWTNAL